MMDLANSVNLIRLLLQEQNDLGIHPLLLKILWNNLIRVYTLLMHMSKYLG